MSEDAQSQAPVDYGPVSVDLTDMPYPHPVSMWPFELYGHDVRMAYMDVSPVGAPHATAVVLLHSYNFSGESWGGTSASSARPSSGTRWAACSSRGSRWHILPWRATS
jgi:hypothetical protein